MSVGASRPSGERASDGGSRYRLRDAEAAHRRRTVGAANVDEEEFKQPTIFPFTLSRHNESVSISNPSTVDRALARDMDADIGGSAADRQVATQRYLIRRPVRLEQPDGAPPSALPLCFGTRPITDACSADGARAQRNVQHTLDQIADVLVKVELLLNRTAAVPA